MNSKMILAIILLVLGLAYFLVLGLSTGLSWIDFVLGFLLIANGLVVLAGAMLAKKNKAAEEAAQAEWKRSRDNSAIEQENKTEPKKS